MEEILYSMNKWWASGKVDERKLGVCRENYIENIEKYLEDREILLLVGPRRTGKTTLFYQIIDILLKKGVEPNHILYVPLDNLELLSTLSSGKEIKEIIDTYFKIIRKKVGEEKVYIFLDEVHVIEGWEGWLKSYYDMHENIKFFAAGSSSILIESKGSEKLTGRQLTFRIYPFSFSEFVKLKLDKEVEKKVRLDDFKHWEDLRYSLLPIKEDIELLLLEYLDWGGFPRIILEKEEEKKKNLLRRYFEDILYKDIVKLYGIKDVKSLEYLSLFLAKSIGQRFSYRKIAAALELSVDTVKEYVNYLEKSYLLTMLTYFSKSMKVAIRKEKKVYFNDVGLRNSIVAIGKEKGNVFENVVFSHLTRKFEVSYWRDVEEVDFIVFSEGKTLPIEVKIQSKIRKSDLKSLLRFCREFKIEKGIVVTDNMFKTEEFNRITVLFIPIWLFLLAINPI